MNHLLDKTFTVINLGCRVNLFESIAITDQLIKANFIYKTKISDAQIVLINTCTVTSRADRKSRNLINRIIKLNKILVILGCYSQINWKKINKNVPIIIGNNYKNKIPYMLNKYLENKKPILLANKGFKKREEFEIFPKISHSEYTRSFIKIQDGCNFKCTYCLIPYARGPQRSLSHINILETIKESTKKGIKEIVLTGVNTAGYNDDGYSFFDLLKDINKLKGNFRVRISSIEPFQINKKIIDLITHYKSRWVQEFHICLQSANNQILKAMNRKYTIEDFIEICKYIRTKNQLASITTDYIVGFNYETEENYKNCLTNLNKIKFSFMNIFPYSYREKTNAKVLKHQVCEKTKFERVKQIKNLSFQWTCEYLKKFLNRTVNVLFEKAKIQGIQSGHSEYFFIVYVKMKKDMTGQMAKVKINKLIKNQLYGVIV